MPHFSSGVGFPWAGHNTADAAMQSNEDWESEAVIDLELNRETDGHEQG